MFAIISQLNIHLFMVINRLADKSLMLNDMMIFAAKYLIYIIPFFLLFLWFVNKKWKRNKPALFYIFFSTLISVFVGWAIRSLYFHPRPFAVGLGVQIIPYVKENSFPSGHAAFMFGATFPLFFLKDRKNGILLFILSFFVGFARVFCGVHFPLDILGSMILSLIVALIVFSIMGKGINCNMDKYDTV